MCEYEANKKTPLEYLQEGYNVPELCAKFKISKAKLVLKYRADLIAFVKSLYAEGKTLSEIGKILDLGLDTVSKLNKEDENVWRGVTDEQRSQIIELAKTGLGARAISSNLSIPLHLVYDSLKNEVALTFIKYSNTKVQEEFHMHDRTISKMLKEEGFRIPNSGLAKKLTLHVGEGSFPFFKPFSKKAEDKIEAELLGDGHISMPSISKDFGEKIGFKDYEEFMDNFKLFFEAKKFEDIPNAVEKYNRCLEIIEKVKVTNFSLHKHIREIAWTKYFGELLNREGYQTRMNEYPDNCYCTSESSFQLQKMHDRWYDGNKKILPKDFDLNADKLLGLYEGDGYFDKLRNRINLSTLNFTQEENNRLKDQINQKVGIQSIVTPIHKNGKEYWAINVYKTKDVDKFLDYLEKNADKEALDVAKKVVPQKFKDLKI